MSSVAVPCRPRAANSIAAAFTICSRRSAAGILAARPSCLISLSIVMRHKLAVTSFAVKPGQARDDPKRARHCRVPRKDATVRHAGARGGRARGRRLRDRVSCRRHHDSASGSRAARSTCGSFAAGWWNSSTMTAWSTSSAKARCSGTTRCSPASCSAWPYATVEDTLCYRLPGAIIRPVLARPAALRYLVHSAGGSYELRDSRTGSPRSGRPRAATRAEISYRTPRWSANRPPPSSGRPPRWPRRAPRRCWSISATRLGS